MDELIETVRQLDAKIQQLLQSKNMDEAQFLRMYAKSKSVQIAFAMGSRSMATMMADSVLKQLGEEE
jgi:ribosomal protein L19E